jgi:hypothetical protein
LRESGECGPLVGTLPPQTRLNSERTQSEIVWFGSGSTEETWLPGPGMMFGTLPFVMETQIVSLRLRHGVLSDG